MLINTEEVAFIQQSLKDGVPLATAIQQLVDQSSARGGVA